MINLWEKRTNIISWTNMHNVDKAVLVNDEQVLEVFHDSIDGDIKIILSTIDEYCHHEDYCINKKLQFIEELLPKGSEVVDTLYTSKHLGVFLLTGEYLVVCSWDTDDLLIL